MKTLISISKNKFIVIIVSLFILQSCSKNKKNIDDYNADVAISWNKKIMELAVAEDNLLTLKGVRTTAMMHTAMHDVLNSIIPKYESYAFKGKEEQVNPIVAASYAAYEVTVSQYPDAKNILELELNKWLKTISDKKGINAEKKIGEDAARAVLTNRADDKWDSEAEYTWHPMAPGVYAEFNEHSGTPEGFIFGSGWAKAKPFLLPRQDYFRSPPPPDISSNLYVSAFNEVKEVGSFESKTRTKDQSHLAMWWKDFVENSHNRLTRQLVKIENLNLWEATRVFALMNMTIYDAYVNVFDNKFYYNHWRPYTAIRWADNDENPNTELDFDWNNLHKHTYAFPSYPSAHGSASSAAMTVLANTLGTGNNYEFTMTTEEVEKAGPYSEKIKMNPPTRTFKSFNEAGLEASMSRIYLGIHFRYDSEEGHKLGNKIGEYATKNFLKPITNL